MEETVLVQVGVNKTVLADNLLQEPGGGDAETVKKVLHIMPGDVSKD
jgi:hypothetical protein